MKIDNIKPAPAEEDHKVEIQGKKKSRERKLKKRGRKFKKRAEKAEAANKKATRDAKRDAAVTENALLKKRLARKDKDVTDALRGSDGFIYLKERVERNG